MANLQLSCIGWYFLHLVVPEEKPKEINSLFTGQAPFLLSYQWHYSTEESSEL